MSNLSQFAAAGIKSIQRGTIAVTLSGASNGSATATITAVNTSKAFVNFLGFTSSQNNNKTLARLELTNSTTVTANVVDTATTATVTVGYEVVEFY